MIHYPIMPNYKTTKLRKGEPVVVYYKLDGTNLCFEWNEKRGFHRQSTRTRGFDKSDRDFGQAMDLFYGRNQWDSRRVNMLDFYFRNKFPKQKIGLFVEFWGKGSFAGSHDPNEPKTLSLIDVIVGDNWLLPNELSEVPVLRQPDFYMSSDVRDIRWDESLIEHVRMDPRKDLEGVVVKSKERPGIRCKIKTLKYLESLKSNMGAQWKQGWE